MFLPAHSSLLALVVTMLVFYTYLAVHHYFAFSSHFDLLLGRISFEVFSALVCQGVI